MTQSVTGYIYFIIAQYVFIILVTGHVDVFNDTYMLPFIGLVISCYLVCYITKREWWWWWCEVTGKGGAFLDYAICLHYAVLSALCYTVWTMPYCLDYAILSGLCHTVWTMLY